MNSTVVHVKIYMKGNSRCLLSDFLSSAQATGNLPIKCDFLLFCSCTTSHPTSEVRTKVARSSKNLSNFSFLPFEFRACLVSRCLCSQNINKYLNKSAKGYERIIQIFYEDLATLLLLHPSACLLLARLL